MYQFFFLPQIFFPFPKFVICCLHIGERKPFVWKQLFRWRSKNHNKTPPNSEKNDLVKCKVFPSNKSGLVQCNVFCDTKKFLFFHAGFVWMIKLVKKKCFVLSTRFPLSKTALFLPKLHSVLKKKRIEGKSCFCVLCNRAIWPSLIINPRLTFCQEKIVDNTYEEKNHLD